MKLFRFIMDQVVQRQCHWPLMQRVRFKSRKHALQLTKQSAGNLSVVKVLFFSYVSGGDTGG